MPTPGYLLTLEETRAFRPRLATDLTFAFLTLIRRHKNVKVFSTEFIFYIII
jgi:hypothetical protein